MSHKKKKRAMAVPPPVLPEQTVTLNGIDLSASVTDATVSITHEAIAPMSWMKLIAEGMYRANPYGRVLFSHSTPKSALGEAVSDQVEALTDGFDGHGGHELPTPPRDLTAYADAFASAAAKCPHEDATELLYGREWVCDACHRVLNRDDMRRAGRFRGFFS